MMQSRVEVGAVILAAGRSSRFGGSPKALAEINGRSLLQIAVDKCRLVGSKKIVLVTGHHQAELAPVAKAMGLSVVHNPGYEEGMFSSVKTGIAAMTGVEAFFVWPVDSVLAHPQTLLTLITVWRKAGEEGLDLASLVPTFRNRTGHPPLFNAQNIESILNWKGPGGLRGWMCSLLDEQSARDFEYGQVPVYSQGALFFINSPADPGLLQDIDTPADFAVASESKGRCRPHLDEAWQLLFQQKIDRRKARHCNLVALTSLRLALALRKAQVPADAGLALVGGILHDLAYGQSSHAQAGKLMAAGMGWNEIAQIIENHTDPSEKLLKYLKTEPPAVNSLNISAGEKEEKFPAGLAGSCLAVYLADKYCQDDLPVNLKTRFDNSRHFCRHRPEALSWLEFREKTALKVEDWFRQCLKTEPRLVALSPTDDPGEEALARVTLNTGRG